MSRKALIVAGSAGSSEEGVDEVLARFGFAPATRVSAIPEALDRARQGSAELLVVPLQGTGAVDLAVLERELPRLSGVMVIGTATQATPDLILGAMRAGVQEFLISPVSRDDLTSAMERLTRRTRPESAERKLIAVYSAKGGLGTTTVAINIGWALTRVASRPRVSLADFVVNGGDVAMMLNVRPAYDVGDLAMKLDQIDGSLLESLLTTTTGNVSVLPASERPETLDLVDGAAATTILKAMRSQYAYTIVDCEHHPTERTLAALDGADHIVVVAQLNVAAMRSTQRTLSLFQRLGVPDEKIVVVANRAQQGDLISPDDAARVLERELYGRIPNDYKVCEAALTRGLPVAAHEPTSAVAKAYVALAEKLAGGEVVDSTLKGDRVNNGQGSRLGRILGIGRK